MTGLVLVLLLGELLLAVGFGWLVHRYQELVTLQRALSRISQVTAARVAQIRDRRLLAEEQLQRFDRQGW